MKTVFADTVYASSPPRTWPGMRGLPVQQRIPVYFDTARGGTAREISCPVIRA